MRLKVMLLALLLGLAGCVKPEPEPTWTVRLVRPDGEVHRAWEVRSKLKPVVRPLWGGQTVLYADNGEGSLQRTTSLGLMAPVGWAFDCERKH